jgi:hypothetical protein
LRISKRQIDLLFGFLGLVFGAINAFQINLLQKETARKSESFASLTHLMKIKKTT